MPIVASARMLVVACLLSGAVLSLTMLSLTSGCQTIAPATGTPNPGNVDSNGLSGTGTNGPSPSDNGDEAAAPVPDSDNSNEAMAKQYTLFAQRIAQLPDKWRFTVARRDGQPLRENLAFEWNYGDGGDGGDGGDYGNGGNGGNSGNDSDSATGTVQEYAYAESGVFTVVVTAFDASGNALFTLSLDIRNTALPLAKIVANAGSNRFVDSGIQVCLDGSQSSGRDIIDLTFDWQQCGGASVSLTPDESNAARACFNTPPVTTGNKLDLTFCLTVNDGVTSAEDAVMITVIAAPTGGGGTGGGGDGGGDGGDGGDGGGDGGGTPSGGTSPPTNTENFDDYSPGSDPAGWVDTDTGNSLATNESLFKVMAVSDGNALGTTSSLVNIHSHEVTTDSGSWTSYAYSGRVMITNPSGGVGLTFFSGFPQTDQYYRLRRGHFPGGDSFHIAPFGTTISGGVTDTGIVPLANVWYQLSIEANDTGTRTEIRAKVWRVDGVEPAGWQINCWDTSATRLRTGTIGVWSMGPGDKFWDDLQIRDLAAVVGDCEIDSDNDGVPDCEDVCPAAPDVDSDGDGVLDCFDVCPGADDAQDTDGDGAPDCQDDCLADPSKTAPGLCGCGVADTDSDGDGTPDCQEPPPTGAPMTTASRTSGIAPLAVFFSAIEPSSSVVQPSDGVHADMYYAWDFGDSGAGTWTTNGKSRNRATGYVAAHVFENPGEYVVSLSVTNALGQVYEYTQTINVQAFSGTTYYVSSSGSDSNDGRSTSTPFRTFDKAMTVLAPNRRVLFARGDVFTTSIGAQVLVPGPGIIGAYGSAALPKPIIVRNGSSDVFMVRGSDWRIMDLSLDDGGNTSTGTGINGGTATQDRLLLLRLDIDGFSMAAWDSFFPVPIAHDQTFVVDCYFSGQGNKGLFMGGTRIAILGSTIQDTASHTVRLWHAIRSVVADNMLLDPRNEPAAVIKLHNTKSVSGLPEGRYVIIADNYIRGHTWDVTIGTEDQVSYEVMRDVVVERNFFEASSTNLEIVRVNARNVTVRNNVADLTGGEYDCRLVNVSQWGIEPPPTGARILHNSVYRGDGSGLRLMAAYLADTKVYNNIAYSPAGGATIGGSGGNFIANMTQDPRWRNPAAGDFGLLSSSSAIDSGTMTRVFDDFDGSSRPVDGNGQGGAEFDIGALEYVP